MEQSGLFWMYRKSGSHDLGMHPLIRVVLRESELLL